MTDKLRIDREAAPIRSKTAEILREAILEGYFKPGQRLYERELCERVGVSRTSIREALRQLESEGLVTSVPNQGPIVTVVTPLEAEEIYQVREVLECLASRLFAERASDAEVARLEEVVAELAKQIEQENLKGILDAKGEFYEVLMSGSGNSVLYSVHRSLMARVNFLRRTSLSRIGRSRESVGEIGEIVAAIRRRDAVAAWNTCGEHVRKAAKVALKLLREESSKNGTI